MNVLIAWSFSKSALAYWNFQLTNSTGNAFLRFAPDRSTNCTNTGIQNCDTEWRLAQQYEARTRTASSVVTPGMAQDAVTWNESHLRQADLLTRTRVTEDASRRPQNQYCQIADVNPEAKSAVSTKATGPSRSRGEGGEWEAQ
jgi:hypothetical protein